MMIALFGQINGSRETSERTLEPDSRSTRVSRQKQTLFWRHFCLFQLGIKASLLTYERNLIKKTRIFRLHDANRGDGFAWSQISRHCSFTQQLSERAQVIERQPIPEFFQFPQHFSRFRDWFLSWLGFLPSLMVGSLTPTCFSQQKWKRSRMTRLVFLLSIHSPLGRILQMPRMLNE